MEPLVSTPTGITQNSRLNKAISRGLTYLTQHQFPNGEFCCYIAADEPMQGWCLTESTVFATMVVASCLLPLADRPETEAMLAKASGWLQYQMHHGGVWPVFSDRHPWHALVPYDTDSMVYASAFMRARGIDCPSPTNLPLLLANRTRKGLFYTWFLLRLNWQTNPTHWRITAREVLHPINSFFFWRANECTRADVDMGINTNVLYYLGDVEATQPIIAELLRVIAEKREDDCDKWYRNPFTIYYLMSRVYRQGVTKLEPARPAILERILATARPDGQLGKSIFDTALAVTTLLNLGFASPILDQAIEFILQAQAASGEWPRWLFYYGGPKLLQGWGSEELTTGFCLEALARYQAEHPHA
ncbi:hypothetical protein [Hymenobacter sp. CRA2]|uniref:hypothetical protein n=1 Tax=Hymenobacter sp. CRA2 TaxID=1955620 RepID=UPI0009D4E541|nr:hypothetical protein [Hymenobacter sp. CRA2]OON67174.1 hypothetical protein B0919_18775 [Hymenobacter sp. CRA2]